MENKTESLLNDSNNYGNKGSDAILLPDEVSIIKIIGIFLLCIGIFMLMSVIWILTNGGGFSLSSWIIPMAIMMILIGLILVWF